MQCEHAQTLPVTQQGISPSETLQWTTGNSLFKEYLTEAPALRELAYMRSMQMFILLVMPPLLEYLLKGHLLASPYYSLYKEYFLEFVAWLLVGVIWEHSGRYDSHEKKGNKDHSFEKIFQWQGQIIRPPELAHAFGSQQSSTDWPHRKHPTLIPAGFLTDRIFPPPYSSGTFCHIPCIAPH